MLLRRPRPKSSRCVSAAKVGAGPPRTCALKNHLDCGAAGGNRHGYAGYAFEPVTAYSLWHVRNRALNSDFGRWIRRDPLRATPDHVDGAFDFVASNPVSAHDVSGLLRSSAGDRFELQPMDPGDNWIRACGSHLNSARIVAIGNGACGKGVRFKIVAHVRLSQTCDCCNGSSTNRSVDCYEEWVRLASVSTQIPNLATGVMIHDFGVGAMSIGTKGIILEQADAKVFCEDAVGFFDVAMTTEWMPSGTLMWGGSCCGMFENTFPNTNRWSPRRPLFWDVAPQITPSHFGLVVWDCCSQCDQQQPNGCGGTWASFIPGPDPICLAR